MTTRVRHFKSESPQDTECIAAEIAPMLKSGDVVLLEGPIGAGKSHFARSAILRLLPVPEDIPSPTFTLVQTYLTPVVEIWHADLYRLGDPGEIDELGLPSAFEDSICFVEWPDRLGAQRPTTALSICLEPSDNENHRILTFSWSDARWDTRMKEVFNDRPAIA